MLEWAGDSLGGVVANVSAAVVDARSALGDALGGAAGEIQRFREGSVGRIERYQEQYEPEVRRYDAM